MMTAPGAALGMITARTHAVENVGGADVDGLVDADVGGIVDVLGVVDIAWSVVIGGAVDVVVDIDRAIDRQRLVDVDVGGTVDVVGDAAASDLERMAGAEILAVQRAEPVRDVADIDVAHAGHPG